MTATQQQWAPPPEPGYAPRRGESTLNRISSIGYRGLVLLLLGLIAILVAIDVWSSRSAESLENRASCTYLTYPYDADEDEPQKATFAELDSQERALADLYDCDIEGR